MNAITKRHEFNGEMLTVREIAEREGVASQTIRSRLKINGPPRKRKPQMPGVRLERAHRGAPAQGEPLWKKQVAEAAQTVAATWWAANDGQPSMGRLRRALMFHSPVLIRLFANGARVTRFGQALCDLGVTLDSGRPLMPDAVLSTWVRIERALVQRMAAQKREAA